MKKLELEYKLRYKTEEDAKEFYEEDMVGLLKVMFGPNEENVLCVDFFDGSESKIDEKDKTVTIFNGAIVLDEEKDILIDFLYDHIDDIENYGVEVPDREEYLEDDDYPKLDCLKLTATENGKFVNGLAALYPNFDFD